MTGSALLWRRLVATAVVVGALAGCASYRGIDGTAPAYGPGWVSEPPNAAAIVRRIWVPDLDDSFDPQGLAIVNGELFLSGFVSTDSAEQKGPCRLYKIDMTNGAVRTRFDLEFPGLPTYKQQNGETKWCGHAGALAYAGGILFVADTHLLFRTTPDALSDRHTLHLVDSDDRVFRGGVAAAGPGVVWLGASLPDKTTELYRFDLGQLQGLADAADVVPGADHVTMQYGAQGAAVRDGRLWVARSDLDWGLLDRVDLTTGETVRYKAPAGIEGMAFDTATGLLWVVSEAGARRFDQDWRARLFYPFYRLRYPIHPLIYAIDVNRLREE